MPQAAPLLPDFSDDLLGWYDRSRRALPWRAPPGGRSDPYAVWLSEIMLQQTTVATVIPYYQRFMALWPDVGALADAPLETLLRHWAGLGYYARARNLHVCAQQVVTQHSGHFPASEAALRALPGIGAYTAAAIASIAFGQRAVVVDGNVERVVARLHAVQTPLPNAKPQLHALADALTPLTRCGDHAQAMMDLGATLCTPKRPACTLCPVRRHCASRGDAEALPRKRPKPERPTRIGLAWWLEAEGHVWLRRRPASGLLGGMVEIPSSPWQEAADVEQLLLDAPLAAGWHLLPGRADHVFTHFRLHLHLARAVLPERVALAEGWWQPIERLADAGLPTALRKLLPLVG
jgi:A/G-specific adenine glycosylase